MPANVHELEMRIERAWQQLPQDMIRRAIDAMPTRMLTCEELGGEQVVGF